MKRFLLHTAARLGELFELDTLLKRSQKKQICLFFHTAADPGTPHLKHLYRPRTEKQFIADIDFLAGKFEFSTTEKLKTAGVSGKPVLHLSFDDGLRECFDIIRPVLLRKGIPAVFFINPAFIGNKKMFHCHKGSLLTEAHFNRTSKTILDHFGCKLGPGEFRKKVLSETPLPEADYDFFANQLEVNFGEYLATQKPYLSEEQLRQMIGEGFEFGGHTMNHPLLQSLVQPDGLEEIKKSINWLHSFAGIRNRYFSFPFYDKGIGKSFFDNMYKGGVETSFGSAELKEEDFPDHFQRISFENSSLDAQIILKQKMMKYILLRTINKHRIKR